MEKLPIDLQRIVSKKASVATWNSLTPLARRDFVSWIESAKLPLTRQKRLARVPSMLASGKRRPCCYTVVPINLYKALSELPKAKAAWGKLTADEKPDFADWIEIGSTPTDRAVRVAKASVMISAGKRKP